MGYIMGIILSSIAIISVLMHYIRGKRVQNLQNVEEIEMGQIENAQTTSSAPLDQLVEFLSEIPILAELASSDGSVDYRVMREQYELHKRQSSVSFDESFDSIDFD